MNWPRRGSINNRGSSLFSVEWVKYVRHPRLTALEPPHTLTGASREGMVQAWRIRVPGAQIFGVTNGIRMGCRDVANGPRARAGTPASPHFSLEVVRAGGCAHYLTFYSAHSTENSEELDSAN